ncbi:unnamed protein product [Gadus morhua 'NCC']
MAPSHPPASSNDIFTVQAHEVLLWRQQGSTTTGTALLPPPATLDHQPLPVHPGPVMPQGVVPQAAAGPHDTALDTSPPEPPGGANLWSRGPGMSPFLQVSARMHRFQRRSCPILDSRAVQGGHPDATSPRRAIGYRTETVNLFLFIAFRTGGDAQITTGH